MVTVDVSRQADSEPLLQEDVEGEESIAEVTMEIPDMLREVDRQACDCMKDTDEEDAPDWAFEDGEMKSKDPNYVFCPAQHRSQLLRLFMHHFCRHPLFPNIKYPESQTAEDVRRTCVWEMHQHCRGRGLAEVWAYMWTSWYSPRK